MKQFYIKNDALGCFLAPKIDVADDDETLACHTNYINAQLPSSFTKYLEVH